MRKPPSDFGITLGGTYAYVMEHPPGCKGHKYVPHCLVLDVPVYSWKVLVECISGPDKGLKFTCSPYNFQIRYRLEDCDQKTALDAYDAQQERVLG